MPFRRSHTKSRYGCQNCKRRRVKCDEARPICNNCRQREEPCAYDEEGPVAFIHKSTRPKEGRSARKARITKIPSSDFQHDQNHRGDSVLSDHSPALDTKQVELVLQWIDHTHKLFARNEETRKVWERTVLNEALSAPFLLHGVLAISALHLSHLGKDERDMTWLDIAIAHKNTALSMFSEQLNCISPSNAKAMMAFSGLAFAFSLAGALKMETHQGSRLDALIEVFSMARGVHTIIRAESKFISRSNFAPLFDMTTPEVTIPTGTLAALDHLQKLHDWYSTQSSDHPSTAYNTTIRCFGRLLAFTYAEPTSMTLAAGWAIRAPAEYIDGLKARAPLALVILAYYCVFLHIARENWCIGSWGHEVFQDIVAELDDEWKPQISWASEQVMGIKLT